MKLIICMTLMAFSLLIETNVADAKTSNLQFEETPDYPFGPANPVLLGDLIIYQTVSDNESNLWAYNTLTSTQTKIFTGKLSQFSFVDDNYLYVINNQVYYVSGQDFNYQFWKTDGTPSGTVQLESPSLFPNHSQIDGLMFAWSNQGTLLSTDGNEVIEHMLGTPLINNICAFDNNDVIAIEDGLTSTGDAVITRSKNGVLTILSEGFPEFFEVSSRNVFNLAGNCYLLINDFSGFKELMVVPKEGEVKLLSDQIDVDIISSIFSFKDRLYATSSMDSNSNISTLSRFNTDLTGFDAEFNFPVAFSIGPNDTFSSEHMIIRASTPNISPRVNRTFFFDQNLNEIEELGSINAAAPTVYSTALGDLFSRYRFDGNTNTHVLSEEVDPDSPNNLITTDSFVVNVINSESSADVYLQRKDKVTGNQSIIKVADVPDINPTTAGLWIDPSINNQGLVINNGRRADGSQYLFVSVYTFLAGEPFWLAGVADIVPPQQSLQIDLSSYSGGEFFQSATETISDAWGQLNLQMTACNNLKATLTDSNNTSHVIDLTRVDNTSFNNVCSD